MTQTWKGVATADPDFFNFQLEASYSSSGASILIEFEGKNFIDYSNNAFYKYLTNETTRHFILPLNITNVGSLPATNIQFR